MINTMQKTLKSLALADAILAPDWEDRYFSYNSQWGRDQEMASMRNGCGDHWFVLFDQSGRVGYKFISMEDGLMDDLDEVKKQIPPEYRAFIEEPAFYIDEATGIWLLQGDEWLRFGKDRAEYIEDLAQVMNWGVDGYQLWAQDYYEQEIDKEALAQVFEHKTDSRDIAKLNPDLSIDDLVKDLEQIGISR